MKKILSVLAVAIVATSGNIYAQYSGDALRFSQTNYGSSARFKGMGNAQMAVGNMITLMDEINIQIMDAIPRCE